MSDCVETSDDAWKSSSFEGFYSKVKHITTLEMEAPLKLTFKTLCELCFKHVVPRFVFVLSVDAQPSDREMLLPMQHYVVLYWSNLAESVVCYSLFAFHTVLHILNIYIGTFCITLPGTG